MLRLATIGLAFLLPLLLLEVALRIAGYDPFSAMRQGRGAFLRPSDVPDLHYELRPGARGLAWGTRVSINSLGFRGPEPDPAHPGRPRILVIGDSVAFGNRLPAGREFPALLQTQLREQIPSAEVLNLAVTGYDTVQEIALLESRLDLLRPDLVVLQYCMNDAGVHTINLDFVETLERLGRAHALNSRCAQWLVMRADQQRQAQFTAIRNDPQVFQRDYAHLIDPLEDPDGTLHRQMARCADTWPSSWYREEARIGRLRHCFRRLVELRREHGFALLAAVVPVLESGKGGAEPPQRPAEELVTNELQRAGIETVDLLVPFDTAGLDQLRLAPGDPIHPNAKGHRIIANRLAQRILAWWGARNDAGMHPERDLLSVHQ